MEFKVGDVVVSKITGQYLNVIGRGGLAGKTEEVVVRLARETKENGTFYEEFTFLPEEIETVDSHLRRELKEMELRQSLLAEAQKRVEQKKQDEILPVAKTTSSVN
jgi:hypothetical protein